MVIVYRSSSNASLERSGSQRRRSLKERSKSSEAPAPIIVPAKTDKLIEAEKAETGKVKRFNRAFLKINLTLYAFRR
jgi:hypothetical protein